MTDVAQHFKNLELLKKNKKYKKKIFVENLYDMSLFDLILRMCGGICLDISHWEDFGKRQKMDSYKGFLGFVRKNVIGCNHISGMNNEKKLYYDKKDKRNIYGYSDHWLKDLRELDYAKKYRKYLSNIVSIELENTLEEQMEVKKYLENLIN